MCKSTHNRLVQRYATPMLVYVLLGLQGVVLLVHFLTSETIGLKRGGKHNEINTQSRKI